MGGAMGVVLVTLPTHGVGEGTLVQIVVFRQQLLHGHAEVWGATAGGGEGKEM